jgi:hypothetical protein
MGKAVNGDPAIDVNAWNAAVGIGEATTATNLRNLDLHTLEYVREKCALFLARSEKYIRIRQDQSTKSQLSKLKHRGK